MSQSSHEVAFSPKKLELLAKILKQKGISVTPRQTVSRRTTDGPIPLTYAQQRLWFLDQLEGGNSSYNIPAAFRLTGRLDAEALTLTLNEIVRRHDMLRTTFSVMNGKPVQVIAPVQKIHLPILDLSDLNEGSRAVEARMISGREAQYVFDLSSEPPIRARLLRLGKEEHIVLLTMHHIITDGWSTGVLVSELNALYRAFSTKQPSPLPELSIQYADFAVWQRESSQEAAMEEQLDYWKQHLADAPAVLDLPTDKPRPAMQSFRGARVNFALPSSLTEQLKTFSEEHQATLFMVLLGAYQVLLMRYSGQEQISVGSPIAGRVHVETEELIGLFASALVMHTDLRGNPTFRELLKRVRETALDAYAHQAVPFERLVEELQPERSLSHSPLFQVMFILQNAPQPEVELEGVRIEAVSIEASTSKFDVTLAMYDSDEGLKGALEYNTDIFESQTIERMAAHFERLLESIVSDPEHRISDLSFLTEKEEQQFNDWNSTARAYEREQCMHELFSSQAAQTPESVALVSDNTRLTYRELDERSNQLAHYLRALGIGPETLVGILMDRSAEMIVALLGVLKAGGAYVPLDPQYPRERVSWVLEDAGIAVLLTEQQYVKDLPSHRAQVVCVDRDRETIAQHSKEHFESGVTADNLAYVIYTSGSTGRPKGVAITHHSAGVLIHWAHESFSVAELAGVLASTSICFDLSVFEIFVPLSIGGKVLVADNALALSHLPAAREVTLVNTVPSVFSELLRDGAIPDTVHTINLAGEPLTHKLAQEIYQRNHVAALYNLYGPSEDTTYSTYTLVPRGDEAPTIGRPVANTQAYVLDRNLQRVPVGVAGELYLSGDGLARGYLNRADLTAEKFLPHPLSRERGARFYKTGDLARYKSNGEIEYLGRNDQQVKIRGFRIELGEIEETLEQHPAIREAVVIAREDYAGEKRLVAYIVATDPAGELSLVELRSHLKQHLPDHFIPSAFVQLAELPQTPNGKVDRRALPAPDGSRPDLEKAYVAPRTQVEEEIAAIWQDVLRIERVGVHDNFFELGGHSLLATQVISRVRESLRLEVPLRSIFESPTVEGLSLAVSRNETVEQRDVIQQVERQRNEQLLERLDELSDEEVELLFPDVLASLEEGR